MFCISKVASKLGVVRIEYALDVVVIHKINELDIPKTWG